MMRLPLFLSLLAALLLVGAAACTPDPHSADGDADSDVDSDADADGSTDGDVDGCDPSAECCTDAQCTDGIYCNGLERCDRGRCEAGFPIDCDDGVDCTRDECDESANRCVHAPQHEECDDEDICTGDERCNPIDPDADEDGCVAGTPLRCDDHDPCTDDYCEEGECRTRIRDADGDTFGDWDCAYCTDPEDPDSCETGTDCNDADPEVHPGAVEICDDGKDNNCDRVRDYADESCTIPNDACAGAVRLVDGGVTYGSTRGATADIDSLCGSATDRDVAFSFTLSAERDVRVRVIASTSISASITPSCGDAAMDRRCGDGRDVDLRERAMPVGTYYVVVSSDGEGDFSVELETTDPTVAPDGDICATALTIPSDGTAVTADLTGTLHDIDLPCVRTASYFDLVYELTVSGPLTGDFTATETGGGTTPLALAVQQTCGLSVSTRGCWTGDGEATGRVWRLEAGTYYVIVAAETETSIEVTATLSDVGPGVYLIEDFTSAPAGWTLAGNWSWGTPGGGSEPSPDDGACIAAVMGGNYPNNMTFASDYAETPALDLTSATAPELTFRAWLQSESYYDGGHIEVSLDGGAFTTIEPAGLSPTYDGSVASQRVWWGTRTTWADYVVPLTDYVGHVVRIRFAMRSDGSITYQGWYVDHVMVMEP